MNRHRKVAEAPVVFMEMVRFEKKMEKLGIAPIFHFCGYADAIRFLQSRYGGVQEVPEILMTSGENDSI